MNSQETNQKASAAVAHTPGLLLSIKATDRVSGTEAWGDCYELILAPFGDPSGVDALFVAFAPKEHDAAELAHFWNTHESLVSALEMVLSRFDEEYHALTDGDHGTIETFAEVKVGRAVLAKAKGAR